MTNQEKGLFFSVQEKGLIVVKFYVRTICGT